MKPRRSINTAASATSRKVLSTGAPAIGAQGYPLDIRWQYFRDEIVLNQALADLMSDEIKGLPQGSTLLIAGRDCRHDPGYPFRVPPGYNLMLLVDQYDAAGGLIDVSAQLGHAVMSTAVLLREEHFPNAFLKDAA
jgi:hypothetical protein